MKAAVHVVECMMIKGTEIDLCVFTYQAAKNIWTLPFQEIAKNSSKNHINPRSKNAIVW
jgi:hypothetical protein